MLGMKVKPLRNNLECLWDVQGKEAELERVGSVAVLTQPLPTWVETRRVYLLTPLMFPWGTRPVKCKDARGSEDNLKIPERLGLPEKEQSWEIGLGSQAILDPDDLVPPQPLKFIEFY